MIPANLVLETSKVLLRPIEESDYDAFYLLAQDPDPGMWQYFSLNLSDAQQLKKWMQMAFGDKQAGTRMPFTIIDKASGKIAGSSSMGNISYPDLRLEIGWSWVNYQYRGTGVNRHAKYAMLRYAFEELKFERVEFKTGVLNDRARKGLVNIGGIEEGTLRSHSALWNNTRRTSVMYSILKDEWPQLTQTIYKEMK